MKVQKYVVTVKHDNGTDKITIPATSYSKAVEVIKMAMGCPESAITNIKRIDAQQ